MRRLKRGIRALLNELTAKEQAGPIPYSFVIDGTRSDVRSDEPGADGTVNWVIPNFYASSGGHRTIFRMARALESAGYDVRFYIMGPTEYRDDAAATAVMRSSYFPLKAIVEIDLKKMRPAEICIASAWETAYAVRDFSACRRRIYFVQDYEPDFFPAGSEKSFAELTYGMGLELICAGPWLAAKVAQYSDNQTDWFPLGFDPTVYYPGEQKLQGNRVVMYARIETPRRGVLLGLLALKQLIKLMPSVEITLFGTGSLPFHLPSNFKVVGHLSETEMADLYRSATVGLSLSLTNYSLVPQEMLACGLPVVELDLPSQRYAFPQTSPAITLVQPEPAKIAAALAHYLKLDPTAMASVRRDAVDLVRDVPWSAAEDRFTSFIRNDRRSGAK